MRCASYVAVCGLLLLSCDSSKLRPVGDAGPRQDSGVSGPRPDSGAIAPTDAAPPAADGGWGPDGAQRDAASELDTGTVPVPATPLRVMLFSRTTGFRHNESIEAGRAALQSWGSSANAEVSATEDPAVLIAELPRTQVVVFLLTTGDVLDTAQQQAFESFVRRGGGFVGIHSAADTEYDWPFYGELVGAWFDSHPAVQPAQLHVEAAGHPAAHGLPATWQRSDEWYNFRMNPRPSVAVVLSLDESSYQGGTMGSDHPIAWSRQIDKGRSFYTALAHAGEAWAEPLIRQHVQNAILWAGGRSDG